MPKSCTKRKIRKLKQAERFYGLQKAEVNQNSGNASRSLKQRVADFFQRITTRSDNADPETCSNNNNTQKYETRDRGDHGVNPFLEDIRDTAERNRADKTRNEGQSKLSVYDAYKNLYNQRSHVNFTPSLRRSSYAKGHTLLSSALIEMYNNEPYFQTVPIYTIKHNGGTRAMNQPIVNVKDDEVEYSIGETVISGTFNLKVLDILEQNSNVTTCDVDTDARRQNNKVVKKDPASMTILDILNEGSSTPVIEGPPRLIAKIAQNPADMKSLIHEYGLTASLHHNNILTPYGQISNGFLIEKMSEDLDTHIKENFDTTQMKLRLRDPIAIGLLKAVSYLHSKNIAHLNINPENILLTADGVPKLANFGLARRVRDEDGQRHAVTGIRGSIPYLCPEILSKTKNDDLMAIDAWAVGVVMYVMFTGGQLPFRGDSADAVYQQQVQGAEWVPHSVRSKMVIDDSFRKYFIAMFLLMNFYPHRRPAIDSVLAELSSIHK